ncbi:MAG: DUF4974 domain-containing protein [Bacteroidales bacterium]
MQDLLEKYCNGECSPAEKRNLFNEAQTNADLREQLKNIIQVRSYLNLQTQKEDVKTAFPSLVKLKNAYFSQQRAYKRYFNWALQLTGYAAAIFLMYQLSRMGTNKEMSDSFAQMDEILEFSTPAGQRAKVKLPDGTEVWLNAKSTLRYSSGFRKERKVELDGQAFFDVATDSLFPFTVVTNHFNIKVLGTKFDVFAYHGGNVPGTSLVEGAIELYKPSEADKPIHLHPNERVELINDHFVKSEFCNDDFLLWKDGIYAFDDVPFMEIIQKLQLYYDIRIILQNKALASYPLSAKFRQRDGIEKVLNTLQKALPFTFTKDEMNNTITIK